MRADILTDGQKVTLSKLAGIASWDEGMNSRVIVMEFEVDNDSDIYKVEVKLDPLMIHQPEDLLPVLDQMKAQLGPHNEAVWDEAVRTLLAQARQNF